MVAMPQKKELFGEIAVKKGYVTNEQVEEALREQKEIEKSSGKHKLIGIVMLELGMIGTTELIDILKYISNKDLSKKK